MDYKLVNNENGKVVEFTADELSLIYDAVYEMRISGYEDELSDIEGKLLEV